MTLKPLKKILFSVGVTFLFSACETFDYHPLHNKAYTLGDKEINHSMYTAFEKDTICFAFVSDTHNEYSKTKQFVDHINERNDIDFVIHGGDFTDYGLRKEYKMFHDIFSKLKVSYLVLIGNHDMLGSGSDHYRELFGEDNLLTELECYPSGDYSRRFYLNIVIMNTNMLDAKKNVSPFDCIRFDYSQYDANTIFFMHSPPKSDQYYDKEELDRFKDKMSEYSGNVLFGIHGHEHSYSENDFFDNGVMFYGCDNIAKRTFLLFKITKDGYTYEKIEF